MPLFKFILAVQLGTLFNGRHFLTHFMSHTKNGFWVVFKWQRKLISCRKKGNFVKYWRDLNRCIRLLVGFKRAIRVFPSVPVERHFSHSWISYPLFIWTSNESLTNWRVIELSRNFAAIKAVLDPEALPESQSPASVNQICRGSEFAASCWLCVYLKALYFFGGVFVWLLPREDFHIYLQSLFLGHLFYLFCFACTTLALRYALLIMTTYWHYHELIKLIKAQIGEFYSIVRETTG